MRTIVEVAVIGGGVAGATASLALAKAGHRVALLTREKTRHPVPKSGEVLSPAARSLLSEAGLAHLLDDPAHLGCPGHLSAWGSPEFARADFGSQGWLLDRARFDEGLRLAAVAAGTRVVPTQLSSLSVAGGAWRIGLRGEEIEAQWIVDATGQACSISRRFGATRLLDDRLMTVYAWLKGAGGGEGIAGHAIIESAGDGWWYTAPLPGGLRMLAFQTDIDEMFEITRSPASWRRRIASTHYIARAVYGATMLGNLLCRESGGSRLDHFSGAGWIAAGDAALTFDPLSSQGLYSALCSGTQAGRAVAAALGGDRLAIGRYSTVLEEVRADYLARQHELYSAEARWRDQLFWRRRRTPMFPPELALPSA